MEIARLRAYTLPMLSGIVKSTIGLNILKAREAAGFKTQAEFARALELPQQRVWDWENDRYEILDTPTLMLIAKVTKTTLDRLVAGVKPGYDQATPAPRVDSGAEPDPTFDVETGYRQDDLPLIAEGEASPAGSIFWDAGGRLLAHVTERISRPAGLIDPKAFGVKVRGDSMLPIYRSGQCVVVSPASPVDDGDRVYVELKSGEHLIKIARRTKSGWILESANPAYEPRVVAKSDIDRICPIVWTREKQPGVRVVDESTGRRKR